ncbi:GNAT family N-acyltransferase [Sulfurimonas sp. HSL3-7]|uniref:acyl-homoserine-lactone synthase n=1 Tax=Sulfonitrofixus jiaomeiensis TaxID=3131938 RepID=UPI0031F9016B
MSYQVIKVSTEDQLEKIYAFRYQIVCEKLGVTELDNCEPNRETDEYDAYSEHFAAFDEAGEVVACTRLIHHSPIGYPTTNYMTYDTDTWHFDQEQLGELSRVFVTPKFRSISELKPLFNDLKIIIYPTMVNLNIAYTFAALEKPFFRLLNMLNFPYKRIGDLQPYIGQRYPSILYMDELYDANRELFSKSEIQ